MTEGYRIKITPEVAEMLQESILDRDNFVKAANEKIATLNRSVEKQVNTVLSLSGRSIHADRGNTTVRKSEGEFYLVVDPPNPTPPEMLAMPPRKSREANGAAAAQPE